MIEVVAVLLFAALTAVVSLQVVNRGVLHLSFIWSEEAARFLFFWVVLIGAALGVRKRRHFVLDLSMGRADHGRSALRLVRGLIPDLCVLGFSVFLLVQGIDYAQTGVLRTATNSHVSMALVYTAIPVFAALAIVYAAGNLMADWRAYRAGGQMGQRPPAAE